MLMNWVDIVLLLILLGFGFFGFLSGFTDKFFSTVSWIAAGLLATHIYPWLKPWAAQHIQNHTIAAIVTFIAVFVALLIVFKVATSSLSKSVKGSPLGSLDRALGVVLGLFTGFILYAALALLDLNYLHFFYRQSAFHESKIWAISGIGASYIGAVLPKHLIKAHCPKKHEDSFIHSISRISVKSNRPSGYATGDRAKLAALERTAQSS